MTILVTAVAAYIVYMRARALRPAVLAEMEARRLAREEEAAEMSEMEAAGTSTALRKPDMRLELDKPPAFADFERWNSSKGSLRTPLAEREGLLGMALNSPSLPHLPRYSSKVIDGDEILLAGRSRSGTTSSRVSVGLMTRQPSEQAPSYFDGSHTPSQAALAEGEEEEGPSGERARRRSEPNWQKRDWE